MNKLRLGIFPNMKKENVKNSLPKVLDLCDKAEIEAVLPQRLDYQDRPSYDVCDRASLKQMHMAVSLGGDGTLLQMTRFLAPLKIPVFGVNFGKLGFLAEIELKELPEALSKLTAGEYVLEERSQLQACVWRDGKVLIDAHALNDMVVAKGHFSKLAHLSLKVNGKRSGNYAADGIIMATATGSTAYSLSGRGAACTSQPRCYYYYAYLRSCALYKTAFDSDGQGHRTECYSAL